MTRVLAALLLRQLTAAGEAFIREEQAGFWPGKGCIDKIFTLRRVLEQRHAYRRPTILVFQGVLDSVDRSAHLNILARQGMPR